MLWKVFDGLRIAKCSSSPLKLHEPHKAHEDHVDGQKLPEIEIFH